MLTCLVVLGGVFGACALAMVWAAWRRQRSMGPAAWDPLQSALDAPWRAPDEGGFVA
jgi:hypothetical protein